MGGIRDLLEKLIHGNADPCVHLEIPSDRVAGQQATAIQPGSKNGCFTVTVNGMRLEHTRRGARTYDPMVLAVTDFLYNGAPRTVATVVGAPMITGATHGIPGAMAFRGSKVAGPHPFYGRLAVTFILYRVLRDDYARSALGAVQKICETVGISAITSTALDIGEGVLDAVDAAFGHGQIVPELGCRVEYTDVKPGSYALLSTNLDPAQLRLDHHDFSTGSATDIGYVAYTIAPSAPVDLSTLPWFQPLWRRIVQWANIPTDQGKEVAKTYLGALYEEIAGCPDIPRDEVDTVYAYWEQLTRTTHERARELAKWPAGEIALEPAQQRALAIREAW